MNVIDNCRTNPTTDPNRPNTTMHNNEIDIHVSMLDFCEKNKINKSALFDYLSDIALYPFFLVYRLLYKLLRVCLYLYFVTSIDCHSMYVFAPIPISTVMYALLYKS